MYSTGIFYPANRAAIQLATSATEENTEPSWVAFWIVTKVTGWCRRGR
jgi:hypothetical protein